MEHNLILESEYIKNGIPFKDRNLIFFDTEVSSLFFDNEITELGWLVVNPQTLEIKQEKDIKIKIEHIENADPKSLELSHYSNDLWTDAISLPEALEMFQQNCKGGVLVGYNVAYDWEWIERAFHKVGIFPPLFHYHKLDVLSMAYIKLKDKTEITKFSLTEICNYFNISRNIEHNALEDARAAFEVYKKLVVL